MTQLICAWSALKLVTFLVLLKVVIHLRLHLVGSESVVNHDSTHSHSKATISSDGWHSLCHLLLHVQTLDLYQILHVLARWVLELSFQLLGRRSILLVLLHLELHVVKDAIEVDRVELDWYFDGRVLLEVHEGLLALLGVDHSCCAFDALALISCDLFAVEHH